MLDAQTFKAPIWYRDALSLSELENLKLHSKCYAKSCRMGLEDEIVKTFRNTDFFTSLSKAKPICRITKASFFTKTETQSWTLPWHQDRVIAVKAKHDVEGFSNWTQKSGVWHCEAPENILNRMLFLRVHLDENSVDNGAMEIANGQLGVVRSDEIDQAVLKNSREVCIASAGDILALPMLTPHRSLPAKQNDLRRVLRFDIAFIELPEPLEWI